LCSVGAVGVDRALCLDAVIRLADTAAADFVASAVSVYSARLVAVRVDAVLTTTGSDAVVIEDALVTAVGVS
jgi:hypothetical protein